MEELIELVVNKTGISQDQAQMAVDVVFDFLKDKLPEPLAGQLDGLLAGKESKGFVNDIVNNLGGLFDK
jgi:uncharacterized protein (DUF2267 family)